MKLKSRDLLCASPASTAICTNMDQRAIVRHGSRPTDHRLPRLGDRPSAKILAPCSSHLPIDPTLLYQKTRKSTTKLSELGCKSSTGVKESETYSVTSTYLLANNPLANPFLEMVLDSPRAAAAMALVPCQPPVEPAKRPVQCKSLADHLIDYQKSPSKPPRKCKEKVVELWVSIHCKGCEGKLRKHLSRMEGVTSFTIDLDSKKVTVKGNVTPLGVLASISKVKNAQIWPSTDSPSSN